jgi:hypothetical protein
VYVKLTVNVVHLLGVIEDQHDEDVNGTLLRKPETQRVTTKTEVVEQIRKQDAGPEGHYKPDDENPGQQTDRGFPVGLTAVVFLHEISSF